MRDKSTLRMQQIMARMLVGVWERALSGTIQDLVLAIDAEGFDATIIPSSFEDRRALAFAGMRLSGVRLAALNIALSE